MLANRRGKIRERRVVFGTRKFQFFMATRLPGLCRQPGHDSCFTQGGLEEYPAKLSSQSTWEFFMAWAIIALFLFFLAVPEQAQAWGPGMHMVTAHYVLDHLELLAPAVSQLLSENKDAFLYGCLSADIFIGKGSRSKRIHSHNWSTGTTLLESSQSPRLRAYALGYMAHLAADVVAHSYYVPNVLYRVKLRGRVSHVLSLIHISEPTRQAEISYAVFCLKKKTYNISI
eukprot:TRINITY_DN42528_c0_g1_i1.p2 TRINITY_DN42528_c0_g1~~TRINITY_DN42528_c0_g1_i1.p2  ORF type:complete len:229 (-),score=31.03 TRINITY_DN42528_c0_g1_i1:3-689(-)